MNRSKKPLEVETRACKLPILMLLEIVSPFRYGFDKDTVQKSTTATSVTGDEGRSTRIHYFYMLGRDTLNNRFDPTEGYLLEASRDYAGIGGDVNYLRANYGRPVPALFL